MLPVALLRLVLVLGLAAGVLAVEPGHGALPVLLVLCLAGAVVVAAADRRTLLEAGVAASVALAAAFRVIVGIPCPPAPLTAGRPERPRRGPSRRRYRPDVVGTTQPRAPGRA